MASMWRWMMSKARIEFDMPIFCDKCPLLIEDDRNDYCAYTNKEIDYHLNKRPSYCPLREVDDE